MPLDRATPTNPRTSQEKLTLTLTLTLSLPLTAQITMSVSKAKSSLHLTASLRKIILVSISDVLTQRQT